MQQLSMLDALCPRRSRSHGRHPRRALMRLAIEKGVNLLMPGGGG